MEEHLMLLPYPQNDAETSEDAYAEVLYQKHAPPIFAYLRLHTASHEDAEDLLVDTFLAALEQTAFGVLPEEVQRAWLWRVARNKVIDHFRRMKRRQVFPLDTFNETMFQDDEVAPEQLALRQEEYIELQMHIKQLSMIQQQVVHLHFAHGLRCIEIAGVLGKREGAVRSLLSRALNSLRSIYRNINDA